MPPEPAQSPASATTTRFPSDLEIAQAASLRPIADLAAELGLLPDEIELYGKYKAKIDLTALGRLQSRPPGKYVVITAITPTPLGEGKSTTTVGLAQGLAKIGKRAIAAIRQPSLGPVFGIKGGAAGGGYAQIVPMEDFNLHLTGDNHAVGAAHNLLAAFLDNHLYHGNALGIDLNRIELRRVVDISDRALREIVLGLGGRENGVPREGGFDITVASECMAILALATSLPDLRARLGRMVAAYTKDGQPVTAEDLRCAGAMTVLMKDALKPNLLQTLEGTPAMVHAGPFGNIAHGNSSIVADQIGLRLADFVVTEAGFGADLGFEKFCDIKCRQSGLRPDAAVLVATVRALKAHSGRFRVVAGRPLPEGLIREDLDALAAGMGNLVQQIENVRAFGVPVVVAINRFPTDSEAEMAAIREAALAAGALDAVVAEHFVRGGEGARALAEAVVKATEQPAEFRFIYDAEAPAEEKIRAIATTLYGAKDISLAAEARRKVRQFERLGYGGLPVCMAKTHLSLSHDAALLGRPSGFIVPVRDVRLSAGAGFLYALCGDMRTMPGLGSNPAAARIDLDDDGLVLGLS
ncbi:MAG TPA: formate--tetrahydrofolate ligase [Dehalococcoidia bacterium]|nr:formate--tetrahydrofolate ligase [Dehalococcoidia bacterium]